MKNVIKKGFTLAEVLIVLVILGIVATLSIRTIIIKTEERETVAKVLKIYSALQEAYDMAIIENGPISNWNIKQGDMTTIVNRIVRPHFRIAKDCSSSGAGCMLMNTTGCKDLSGYNFSSNSSASAFNPCSNVSLWTWYGAYYRVLTQDGYALAVLGMRGESGDNSAEWRWTDPNNNVHIYTPIVVDLNGVKAPNQLGRDIFVFLVTDKGIMTPGPFIEAFSLKYPNSCNTKAIKKDKDDKLTYPSGTYNTSGFGCSHWIIENKNMRYLRNR